MDIDIKTLKQLVKEKELSWEKVVLAIEESLMAAYKVLYKDGLSFEEAKLAIHAMIAKSSDQQTQEALTQFHQFLAASTRGIIR